MTTENQYKVIIIGGGVAGISAGIHLAKNNIPFVLLEQKNFIGGRAYSYVDSSTGDIIDNGQHLLMGVYKNFLELIEELGTAKYLSLPDTFNVPFIDSEGTKYNLNTSKFKGKLGIFWGLLNLNSLGFWDKLSIIRFVLKLQTGIVHAKGVSVKELLKYTGQTDKAIKYFWEPITLATLNAGIDNASDELFVSVLKLAFFGKQEDSKLILPKTGLSELFSPFEHYIKHSGSEIRYKTKAARLLIEDKRCIGVELNSGEQIFADRIISCIQPNILVKVLLNSGQEDDKLIRFRFSSILSVYLWYDKDFINHKFVSCIGTKIQWIFNRNRITDRNNKELAGHYAITISAADDLVEMNSKDIIEIVSKELSELFPESKNVELKHYKVIKDKRATPLLDTATNSIRPDTRSNVKNLYLAGDWTKTGLPATLEGAALSGKRAAAAIFHDLGRELKSLV